MTQSLDGLGNLGDAPKNGSGTFSVEAIGNFFSDRPLSSDDCDGCDTPDVEAIIDLMDVLTLVPHLLPGRRYFLTYKFFSVVHTRL